MTLYVVAVNPRDLELSFIRPHIERVPAKTVAVHGYIPTIGDRPVLSNAWPARLVRKITRTVLRRSWDDEIATAYVRAFSRRPAVVLAEFGPTAVRLIDPCRRAGIPLVAHFHGYDISVRDVLAEHADGYQRLFREAAAIIAVSRSMRDTLLAMGAPNDRLHYCPYGVDCEAFQPACVASAPPTALAVGRFVDKKAPHLTIMAFAEAHRRNPSARLRMIGDGALRSSCEDLVAALGLSGSVDFLGHQPHSVIASEMRQARCFVQHSLQAANGDCEGTPNSILEAGASALPVVSTRHAGIPDVVIDGHTGFLVDERDVRGMAESLSRLFEDATLAARMGVAARRHISATFAIDDRLSQLWAIIERAGRAWPRLQTAPAAQALQSPLGSSPR